MQQGLLIINLGTPDQPDTASVRRYLAEFLIDKRVIDLPAPIRQILVYGLILPFRPRQSAKAYQSIWTAEGSPLLVHSEALKAKLQTRFTDSVQVALGMRYGNPSIPSALMHLKHCKKITILPLFPQYASAANGSAIEAVLKEVASWTVIPALDIIPDFYDHPGFIKPQAALIRPYLQNHDHLLLSYHGLPQRHIQRSGCQFNCQTSACPPIQNTNQACYRAQCYATSRALASALGLSEDQYSVSFQSRLGKTPWIQPFTDEIFQQLAQRGIKTLAVSCPSFVADCLETLEEIAERGQEQWRAAGGKSLSLIPALNAEDSWVDGLMQIIKAS